MVLIKHIKSSGIAEVVIALAVIAMCFTVASLVFIRTSSAPMKFQDVRKQTEIQSSILMKMYQEDRDIEIDETEMGKETDMFSDSLEVLTFTGSDNRILWQQQWFKK